MKRILLVALALCLLLCLAGCSNGGDTTTTTTTEPTTENAELENKRVLARIGFEEIMGYLNTCAEFGVPLEVNEGDTIDSIVTTLRNEGSYIPVNNIDVSKKFFDYAIVNPDYGSGGKLYISREDADWLTLYVD